MYTCTLICVYRCGSSLQTYHRPKIPGKKSSACLYADAKFMHLIERENNYTIIWWYTIARCFQRRGAHARAHPPQNSVQHTATPKKQWNVITIITNNDYRHYFGVGWNQFLCINKNMCVYFNFLCSQICYQGNILSVVHVVRVLRVAVLFFFSVPTSASLARSLHFVAGFNLVLCSSHGAH